MAGDSRLAVVRTGGPPAGVAMTASCLAVLLRMAHLVVTNDVTPLPVLPMSDRDEDIELLALHTDC